MTGYVTVPAEELACRREKVQAGLQRDGIDLALIVQSVDLYYLTGTVQQGHLLLPAQGEPLFLVRRNLQRARAESALSRIEPMEGLGDLPRALERMGIAMSAVLGLELDVLPVSLFRRYEGTFPRARYADCSPAIREARAVKTALEVDLIRQAGWQVDLIYRNAAHILKAGMSEIEVAAELEAVARKAGHHGFVRFRAFNQELYHGHLISGPDSSVGSHVDTPLAGRGLTPAVAQGAGWRVINRGEPVVMDLSGGVNGYLSDQTRVFVVGALAPELAEAYRACRRIQDEVVARLLPGASCGGLYQTAVDLAGQLGYADAFMGASPYQVSFVGHGVGLEIDEPPYIARGSRQVLSEGNVVAIEPKLVFPGVGAVGVENTWLVKKPGPERLTFTTEEVIAV